MPLLIYFLKMSVCSGLFYLFYVLFLRRLTFFRINRFYLLITLLLSIVIPIFHFNVLRNIERSETTHEYSNTFRLSDTHIKEYKSPSQKNEILPTCAPVNYLLDKDKLIILIYFLIAAIILIYYAISIRRLISYIETASYEKNGLKVIYRKEGFTNCSFLKYIFLDDRLSEEEMSIVLVHESVHAMQYHSLDRLLLMVLKSIFWINPFIYLYKNAIEQVHEYEADSKVSSEMGNANYAKLLFKLALPQYEQYFQITNSFVKSPLKNRIKMLFNQKSKNMKKFNYLLSLPMTLMLLWLFGIRIVYAQTISTPKITKATSSQTLTPPVMVNNVQDSLKQVKSVAIIDSVPTGHVLILADSVSSNNYTIVDTVHMEDVILGDNNGCRITSIGNDQHYTIISFEFTSKNPDDWALLNKEIYLQANNDMKHFSYVKSEGIPMPPYRHNFSKQGEKLNFKVYFEKVPVTARTIDVIERAGRSDFFNFYNVQLPKTYFEK